MYEKIPTIISINMNCEYFVYKTCQKSEFIIKSSMPSEIIRLKFFERCHEASFSIFSKIPVISIFPIGGILFPRPLPGLSAPFLRVMKPS